LPAVVAGTAGSAVDPRRTGRRNSGAGSSGAATVALADVLTFCNADYFKRQALVAANAAGPDLQWFVIDAITISDIDINGLYALRDLREALEACGTAGRRTEFRNGLRDIGHYRAEHEERIFPTLRQALKAYQREARQAEVPPDEE
jgi:MFS superfamily sulfate permease-like transporter